MTLKNHKKPLPFSAQCQQYRESTSVLENQPAGTFVLQVHAVDADEGSNGKVTYGFMHKDSTVPAFSIHPDTGTKNIVFTPADTNPQNWLMYMLPAAGTCLFIRNSASSSELLSPQAFKFPLTN